MRKLFNVKKIGLPVSKGSILLLLFLLAVPLFSTSYLLAQDLQDPIEIPQLKGEIKIDGMVDDPSWSEITPMPLTMHWPDYQGQLTEMTEIRVAYDREYLYVSGICHDSEPDKIQATSFQRDNLSQTMDHVVIILDTYDDNENSLIFAVTPTGSRVDMAVKNDAQGDSPVNDSWNSYWIANTTMDEHGWQVEMRIPFSSLRFQVENNEVKMGMSLYRYIPRKREMQTYPAIRPDWGFWSFAKASQAQTVSFNGIENKRPWYVSPYVLGGIGHHYEDNESGAYQKFNDNNAQAGLDVQHAISDNLNADFTINTDFAQVEADNQVVNLSRFSLFFPEKRKFFLERASVFDFKYDLNNNMFYSRRIGIIDGEIIPLWGGARLVGRFNKWDVGMLNLQSRARDENVSENFGAIRIRKNVFNPRSYVGGMMTSRIGTDGHKNYAYGIDGIINVFKQDYLKVNLAQSYDTDDTSNLKAIDKSRIYIMWENRIINGFGYKFSYSNVGNEYKPGIGFEQRQNFSQFSDKLFYSWFAPESSNLRQTTIEINGGASINNTTNKLETSTVGLAGVWIWDRNNQLNITLDYFNDNVPDTFDLSDDISITPDTYTNNSVGIFYGTAPVGLMRVGTNFNLGTFYGGELISFSVEPEIIFSKFFQLSGFYQYNHINFSSLDKTFTSHIARLNMVTSFSVKFSISAFVQVNSLQDISALNFRFRYNPVDGNDLYFVYNETLNNKPMSIEPRLPVSDNRAIMVKYIHTFRW